MDYDNRRIFYSYDRNKQAGGIDVSEDVRPLLSGLSGALGTFDSRDIAHGSYLFWLLAEEDGDPRVKSFANALATEYAKRFAEWLGYVFLNRANLTQKSKAMKALQEAIGTWVETIPSMLEGKAEKRLSSYIPKDSERFLDLKKIDAIASKILRVVYQDWTKGSKTARGLEELPIKYNPKYEWYEIPKSKMTYVHRRKLHDLGFEYGGIVWHTDTLDPKALRALPQAAKIQRQAPKKTKLKDPKEWFFQEWLPGNIDRFTKVFTDYGRAAGVPYEFLFSVNGEEVTVDFRRNIQTIPQAVAELEARYGGTSDRDGWMEAVGSYKDLLSSSGRAALQAVDRANDLEHSHGAMMEHFPPGVRKWYPQFLDFKYSAHPWQLVKKIRDEDLRTIATELMPLKYRMERLVTPKTDHRTVRGLVMEISSEPGKAAKRKRLRAVKERYPDMYVEVVEGLEEKGLHLT